jgi:uncharacterized protein
VLRATFLHLDTIGPVTEAHLWRQGVLDWKDLATAAEIPNISDDRRHALLRDLARSEEALADQDVGWFTHRLPMSELWRLYPSFRPATAFLDIETTGLSPYEGIVTVVTVHGAGTTRTFVADDDLEELPAWLRRFQLLVSFNGRLFDVPFLETRFPQLVVPVAHIDLRFVLYRLGLSGGLKRIEERVGIGGRAGVEGVRGLDAVRLWEEFRAGQTASLERLVKYNRADTVNLEPLLEFAVRELTERLLGRRAPTETGTTTSQPTLAGSTGPSPS